MEWSEVVFILAAALSGLLVGAFARGKHRGRRYMPRPAIAPYPTVTAGHDHDWYRTPYLHDPASAQYLYSCARKPCGEVLRSAEKIW